MLTEPRRKQTPAYQKRLPGCIGAGCVLCSTLLNIVIETPHTQISRCFWYDGTAQPIVVSGDYMRWLGYFIFAGIKMATDGVLRGLGIMRPFLIARGWNLRIRLSVALILHRVLVLNSSGLLYQQVGLRTFLISYVCLEIIKSIVSGCIFAESFFKHAIEKCFSIGRWVWK